MRLFRLLWSFGNSRMLFLTAVGEASPYPLRHVGLTRKTSLRWIGEGLVRDLILIYLKINLGQRCLYVHNIWKLLKKLPSAPSNSPAPAATTQFGTPKVIFVVCL